MGLTAEGVEAVPDAADALALGLAMDIGAVGAGADDVGIDGAEVEAAAVTAGAVGCVRPAAASIMLAEPDCPVDAEAVGK